MFDTRKTSGLGIVSCASCHPDTRMDRLAWDIGDPAGKLVTLTNSAPGGQVLTYHPMKGPMVTQTLQDIITPPTKPQQLMHWRGDRLNIEDFNQTFTNLLANDVALTADEMTELKVLLSSIFTPPNVHRTFSNTFPALVPLPGHYGIPNGSTPTLLPPGNPQARLSIFSSFVCTTCHDSYSGRSATVSGNVVDVRRGHPQGFFLTPQLRNLTDKTGMDGSSTNGRAGFGFMHDGRVDTLSRFLNDGFAVVPASFVSNQRIADMVAFLL
ncbi:MAG TPA: hypothetical protein VK530_15915, partial [Candidatus Acidoferrum sp.]|nr:hypothetical protein [Candidatus Acidoferrum sp.]